MSKNSRRGAAAILIATAMLALIACGEEGEPLLGVEAPADIIAFGKMRCGAVTQQTILVKNLGDADLNFELSSTLAEVTAEPATGKLAPGASITVALTAQLPRSAVPGRRLEGHLVILSNTPVLSPRLLPIFVDVTGVSVAMRPELDLGVTSTTSGTSGSLFITARGTDPLTVAVGPAPLPFHFTGPSAITIDPTKGRTGEIPIAMSSRLQPMHPKVALPLVFSGNVCGDVPISVEVQALATDDSFRPIRNLVDFGEVGCSPARGEIFFSSLSTTAVAYQASVLHYGVALEEPERGTIDGFKIFHFLTKDNLWPPVNSNDDRLLGSALFTIPGNSVSIELRGSIRRAQLDAPALVSFGSVPLGSAELRTIEVTNRGNALAEVELDQQNGLPPGLTVSPTRFVIPAGESRTITAMVRPQSGAPGTGFHLPITFTAPNNCTPLTIDANGSVAARE